MEFGALNNRFLSEVESASEGRTCGYRELSNLCLGASTAKGTRALGKPAERTRRWNYHQQQGLFGLAQSAELSRQKHEGSGRSHSRIHYSHGCISYCHHRVHGFDARRSKLCYEQPRALLPFSLERACYHMPDSLPLAPAGKSSSAVKKHNLSYQSIRFYATQRLRLVPGFFLHNSHAVLHNYEICGL